MRIHSAQEEETLRVGERVAAQLREGDVVLLRGEMGAGKSVFCRGVARGLGVEGPVPSPTFTLLNIHAGNRATLYHFDLYRLDDAEALYELGLNEFIGARGVTLVEWPERAWEAMPDCRLEVEIRYAGADGLEREIELTPCGGFAMEAVENALKEEA